MNDEGKVNEWVKVIAIILNNSRGDIGVEGGNEPIIQAVDVVT